MQFKVFRFAFDDNMIWYFNIIFIHASLSLKIGLNLISILTSLTLLWMTNE